MGFSDIDLHTAPLAPFLAESEHGLQFVRISADEYNVIDEGQGSHPGATLSGPGSGAREAITEFR